MEGIYAVMDTLLPLEALRFSFMKNAFLAILLLTPLLGLLGTMAVNQQMAFFSDALGHSALTGIGLGMILGVGSDLVSMLVFGIVWAVLISVIKHTGTSSADTVISVFSSTSVALGLLILSRGGGFARYSSLLIGDVLAVTPMDLLYLLLALLGGIALWMVLYNGLLLTSVSQSLAASRGVKTRLYEICYPLGGRHADQCPADHSRCRGPESGQKRQKPCPDQRAAGPGIRDCRTDQRLQLEHERPCGHCALCQPFLCPVHAAPRESAGVR